MISYNKSKRILQEDQRDVNMAKREVVKLIRRFLAHLLKEGIPVEKAFLYGSYARGEGSDESDIDVMLVSEIFDNNEDQLVGKTWRISQSVDSRIEPYTVGKKRFLTDQWSPLLQIVKKGRPGNPIVTKSPGNRLPPAP